MCAACLVLVVVPIVWVVGEVVVRAAPHLSVTFLTDPTVGNGGGAQQAIVGTVVLTALVAVVAGLGGIGTGVYLSEYCPKALAGLLRSVIEVLAGVPSIVVGYVAYVLFATRFHWGFSIWSAVIALSAIVIPYIARTTELAVKGVPGSFREAAAALGLSEGLVLRRILIRSAAPGILTGMVLALALSVGETAPLIYTAGWSVHDPTFHLHNSPVGYLTYLVWTFYDYPVKSASALASEAAFFLVVLVGVLIVASRLAAKRLSRYLPYGQA
jgi:phosphate transport system permease protein